MKKALLFTLSICLVAALLIFSGSSDRGSEATYMSTAPSASSNVSPSPEENTIRIGVPASLTGPGSTDDARVLLGLRYAHSVTPTVDIGSTTYKLELVETDDAGTDSGAQSAAAALSKGGVTAVIGPFLSQSAREALPAYAKADLPVLSVCGAEDTASSNSFFSLAPSVSLSGRAAAGLAQSLDRHSAAVLSDNTDSSSQALAKAFVEAFTALGGACTEIPFTAGKKLDLVSIQAIEQCRADIVFMASSAEDGEAFLQLARKNGILCPVIGSSAWDAGLLLSDADYYSDNVYVVADYDGCGDEPVSAGFASRFSAWTGDGENTKRKNGGSTYASSYSATAYDAYMLLVGAIKSAASTDPAAVTDALRQTSYNGVTGPVAFDKGGRAARTVTYIKQLDADTGRFALLKTIEIGG
ncbi:MAG: ABC transporter substrate-binding protein [Oscillospiraceae bacterium]|jgi:branched-chain amino acid transport system substrate-binding protein